MKTILRGMRSKDDTAILAILRGTAEFAGDKWGVNIAFVEF